MSFFSNSRNNVKFVAPSGQGVTSETHFCPTCEKWMPNNHDHPTKPLPAPSAEGVVSLPELDKDGDFVMSAEMRALEQELLPEAQRVYRHVYKTNQKLVSSPGTMNYVSLEMLRASRTSLTAAQDENKLFRADNLEQASVMDALGDFPCGHGVIHKRELYRDDLGGGCSVSHCLYCRIEKADAEVSSLRSQLEDVVFIHQCSNCAWMGNPTHLGQKCRACCQGNCIRVATSREGEHRIVQFSNWLSKAEHERDELKAQLSSRESAEDAFKRGQQNMIELTAAALDMAGLPEKAELWRGMMAPFAYTAPKGEIDAK